MEKRGAQDVQKSENSTEAWSGIHLGRSAIAEASGRDGFRARKRASGQRWYIDVDWARSIEAVAAQGDRDAFNQLFAHFAPRVKSLMMKNGASNELAEEIAQETLLIVWRKASQFDPSTGGVAAWIFTIARNLRIDLIRKARSAVSLEQAEYLTWEDEAMAPDAMVQSRQDSARVQRALAALPYEQVEAIKQAYYEEKSHGEIAAEAIIPLGTVKSRLRLAIQRLRTVLDNDR
jgi:RNA polymerase sigma-70 factor, ECF subfamily